MTKEKATSPEKKAALEAIRAEFSGQDAKSQRDRLLEALKRLGMVSTFEAMRYLDIYDPRPRIHDLRHRLGYKILTVWKRTVTESGELHRVGFYTLVSEVRDV